jgi:hypothetical protein
MVISHLYLILCDGDEVNGAPGLSVIQYLEKKELILYRLKGKILSSYYFQDHYETGIR